MKRILLFLSAAVVAVAAGAQTLNVETGSVTYAVPAAQAGDMVYADGNTLTILGKTFTTGEITRMYIDNSDVEDNTVTVNYTADGANVLVAGNIAQYVTPTVSGAHVTIVQAETVGDDTCGEITYSLAGASDDGEFTLEGSYKATLELLGLTLTNPNGAPINIQNGKRIEMSVKSGTQNTLTDGADGSQKGCIVCKGHLELKGKGTLDVYGKKSHGIYSNEYVSMKNCTVNVLASVKDGLNCSQYFLMESGTLNISGNGDDAIQVSFKDDTDREAEDTGSITISGGTINASTSAKATKALKADGNILISGGELTLATTGGGTWDSEDAETKASSCISADGTVQIDGGVIVMNSSGSGGKGISSDGVLTINGGEITITTSGGTYAYVNGTEYDNYTGNLDNLDSSLKSSPKGIKVDADVVINGGSISVTATGNGAEGIESKATLTVNDGTVVVNSRDDCINSSSHMYINGGDITVIATGNDGLDSNGNLYINGGTVRTFGSSSSECGIDANSEEGYSVIFTGGTLLAVGGNNSTPSTSASTQAYVSGSGSVTAGQTITLSDSSNTLATFTVPSNYGTTQSNVAPTGPGGSGPGGSTSGGSILVSCAGLTSGNSYTLVCGTTSTTVTATLTGSSGGNRP